MPADTHAAVEHPAPLLHTYDGALELIPISRSSLRKLVSAGTLPTVIVAGRKLIRHADLLELVERGTV